VTERPADLLKPGLEDCCKQCRDKGLPDDEETAVLFAMFPQQVETLLKPKTTSTSTVTTGGVSSAKPQPTPASPAISASANSNSKRLFVTVNGKRHDVTVETLE
jgi:oxaloacetate decarboxylase alpha subunit/pyruvate carboxylase subunit B